MEGGQRREGDKQRGGSAQEAGDLQLVQLKADTDSKRYPSVTMHVSRMRTSPNDVTTNARLTKRIHMVTRASKKSIRRAFFRHPISSRRSFGRGCRRNTPNQPFFPLPFALLFSLVPVVSDRFKSSFAAGGSARPLFQLYPFELAPTLPSFHPSLSRLDPFGVKPRPDGVGGTNACR